MKMRDGSRRIVRIGIGDVILIDLFSEGIRASRVVKGAIPKDARFVGAGFEGRTAWVYFEHESFEWIEPGQEIPERTILFKSDPL